MDGVWLAIDVGTVNEGGSALDANCEGSAKYSCTMGVFSLSGSLTVVVSGTMAAPARVMAVKRAAAEKNFMVHCRKY